MTNVEGPPGSDAWLRGLLRDLNSKALEHTIPGRPNGYRTGLARADPLMFALIYVPHMLRSPETGDEISLSIFHIDLAYSARRWMRRDLGPAEVREGWISCRNIGKSTWLYKILPLWALCFGHRRFALMIAGTGGQAKLHFDGIRRELRENRWLREDFPELCTPAGGGGNTDEMYLARSGQALIALGVDQGILGLKVGDMRPDLILLDDVERGAGNYSPAQKTKRLGTIIDDVLPMNVNAVVVWSGTTTMFGSATHELVRAALGEDTAEWIREQKFVPRYYPAILDYDDGSRESIWWQRWSLEYLESIEGTNYYAKNFANQPMSAEGTFWQKDDFQRWSQMPVFDRVLSIDPAVTSKETSDYTGLAVVGADDARAPMNVVVEYAVGLRLTPAELRALVLKILKGNPTIKTVLLEDNQGKDTWSTILKPLPIGVRLVPYHSSESKPDRYAECHDCYQRGWIYHSRPLPHFENQAMAYPQVQHDDVLDAVSAGILHYLHDRVRT